MADVLRSATLMLLDKENMTRQYIDDYLSLHHIESNNQLEVSTMDLLIEFAKVGLGVACDPPVCRKRTVRRESGGNPSGMCYE